MPASGTFITADDGLAGAKTAEALRELGFVGRIVLAAEEEEEEEEEEVTAADDRRSS